MSVIVSTPMGTILLIHPARAAAATVYNVTSYGAKGDGTTDATAAFAAAIAAAQKTSGGMVYVPAGTFAFTKAAAVFGGASIRIVGDTPIVFEGAGSAATSLVEHVKAQPLLFVGTDSTAVQDLTLDSKTFGGGHAIMVRANNTTVQNDDVLGATLTAPIGHHAVAGGSPFALYYTGPPGAKPSAPLYNVGNKVLNDKISDGVNNDGFSFSFQKDATITNITHFGSRLALYVDSDVTVTNYSYTPNPACLGATNGFYIGSPSNNITITNFTTSGQGGVIGGPEATNLSSNISIIGERFTSNAGDHLEVGNTKSLTISGSSFGSSGYLLINPQKSASSVVVKNTTLPGVVFAGYQGHSYASVAVAFDADTFPSHSFEGKSYPTFQLWPGGTTTVSLTGGKWSNKPGGFSKGIAATFSVSGVEGLS